MKDDDKRMLDELKALAVKARTGQHCVYSDLDREYEEDERPDLCVAAGHGRADRGEVLYRISGQWADCVDVIDNAKFDAATHTYMPRLLAMVSELQADADRLRAAIRTIKDIADHNLHDGQEGDWYSVEAEARAAIADADKTR